MAGNDEKPMASGEAQGAGDAARREAPAAPGRRGALLVALVVLGCLALLLSLRSRSRPKTDEGAPAVTEAKGAYEAVARALEWTPDDLDGAIARFAAVQSSYPGSEWARRAAERVAELKRERDDATRARVEEGLGPRLAALRAKIAELVANDEFGDALNRLDVFAIWNPLEVAICETVSLRSAVVARAKERYEELAQLVEAAIEQKDYAAARAILKLVKRFGVPDLAERARRKLAEIDSREQHAEQWAMWDAVAARAKRLAESRDFDEALELLEGSKSLPPENAAALVAEATAAVEEARSHAAKEAIAAYEERSSGVWLLLMERSYAEAEQLIDELRGWPDYQLADEHVRADQAALELLRDFWVAVERGVAGRLGRSFVIRDLAGTLLDFGGGLATLQAADPGEGELVFSVPIRELTTEQAVACAGLGDDAHSRQMLGVLLLAEARDLDTLEQARKALDAAGDGPFMRLYMDKLARTRRHMVESAAAAAWQQIAPFLDEWLTGARAMTAHFLLSRFQADYADTGFIKRVAGEIAALRERIKQAAGRPRFLMKVVVKTAADGLAGSEDLRVHVLINGDERYKRRLDRFHYGRSRWDVVDTYHFDFYTPMPKIKGATVAVEGPGAWECDYIEFQFLRRRKWSKPRRFVIGQVLSSEKAAIEEGARESLWLPFTPRAR